MTHSNAVQSKIADIITGMSLEDFLHAVPGDQEDVVMENIIALAEEAVVAEEKAKEVMDHHAIRSALPSIAREMANDAVTRLNAVLPDDMMVDYDYPKLTRLANMISGEVSAWLAICDITASRE